MGVPASADDPWSLDRRGERARIIVRSRETARRLGPGLRGHAELIRFHRTFERGGLERLRDLLHGLEGGRP
jgi:hypothetical protein